MWRGGKAEGLAALATRGSCSCNACPALACHLTSMRERFYAISHCPRALPLVGTPRSDRRRILLSQTEPPHLIAQLTAEGRKSRAIRKRPPCARRKMGEPCPPRLLAWVSGACLPFLAGARVVLDCCLSLSVRRSRLRTLKGVDGKCTDRHGQSSRSLQGTACPCKRPWWHSRASLVAGAAMQRRRQRQG